MHKKELTEEIEAMLSGEIPVLDFFHRHPWLLIPDLEIGRYQSWSQGIYEQVEIYPDLHADFVTFDCMQGRMFWTPIMLLTPIDPQWDGEWDLPFQEAVDQCRDWLMRSSSSESLFSQVHQLPGQPLILTRIVLGRSHNWSPKIREAVEFERRSRVRIRSYDWLYEKAQRFQDSEIELFEAVGPPRPGSQIRDDAPQIMVNPY